MLTYFAHGGSKTNSASLLDETNRLHQLTALCCATTVTPEERSERLKSLLSQDVDWYCLTRAALQHRVFLFVYDNLRHLGPGCVPNAILAAFENFHYANGHRNSALIEKLVEVIDLLNAHGIRVIPYKGPLLAITAYGNVALRQASADLDILVHHRDFVRAKDLLLSQGFQQWMQTECKSHLHRPVDNLEIDVHHAIVPRSYGFSLDFEEIWGRRRCLVLPGTSLPYFSQEDLLMMLCLDLTKDIAERNFVPLIKLCDIAKLLEVQHEMDWDWLLNHAQHIGAQSPLSLGLCTVGHLFDISVPIDGNTALDTLCGQVIRHVLDPPDPETRDFGGPVMQLREIVRRHLFIVSLQDRVRDKTFTLLCFSVFFCVFV
jgi:hypothetical protein